MLFRELLSGFVTTRTATTSRIILLFFFLSWFFLHDQILLAEVDGSVGAPGNVEGEEEDSKGIWRKPLESQIIAPRQSSSR